MQMQRAPQGATFISCCTAAAHDDKALARRLGRADLNIISPSVFDDFTLSYFHGRRDPVVIDHAFHTHPETGRKRYENYSRAVREFFPLCRRDDRL